MVYSLWVMTGSDAYSCLVGVFGHEITEDFNLVEEFAIEVLLGFHGGLGVGKFDPDVSLVVLFDKALLNNAIVAALSHYFFLQVLEKFGSCSLHFE